MKTVYKYPLQRRLSKFSLMLPVEFKFLRIGIQDDELFMWAEIYLERSLELYHFQLFGTGHSIPDGAIWLATYDDGPFVLHLYQVT